MSIIEITIICSKVINLAMQQNHVPVIRQLLIQNHSDQPLSDLTVTITSDPMFTVEWTTTIATLAPEQTMELSVVDLHLSASYLFSLTERLSGTLHITVRQGEAILAQSVQEVIVLAHDEWSGAALIPEMVAAFVTPNHPYVAQLLRNASAILEQWDNDPSFTGYQRQNPNAVRRQMAAIYNALQQEHIAYCNPPASFEDIGQRIRLCDAIREQRLGTCLDLTLLYASCLEAVGLNPLVIFLKGHAFAGCWLENSCFPECVQDDISMLTKRTASGIHEICLLESTCFTAEKETDFDQAVHAADSECEESAFHYFVDIKRCRSSQIRPLPLKITAEVCASEADAGTADTGSVPVAEAPAEIELQDKIQYVDHIDISKQQVWERKLLDLSLRNTLLNFRVTKSCVQLLISSPEKLEDQLSNGAEFQIMHFPADLQSGIRDDKIFQLENNQTIADALVEAEFAQHRIRTFLNEMDLSIAVKGLYRSARSSLEENGANTLYLALGFLKWYETDISEKARYAPLILLPVEIVRRSAQRGYVIRLRDEEIQFNITLLEWLHVEFGLTIGGLDPLPADDNGVNVRLVFNIVRQAVMSRARWDVEELAFIGLFSFSQFIMWNDIRNRSDDLRQNKVVASLMSGKMEWTPETHFPESHELDDLIAPGDVAVPLSADSSQLAAICAAGQGNSFVLHGPPGTGKSQTITNMIANALYQGKSVLFIAEKMAALSVVQRRLQNIGLAPFCLEVHSNKAKKKDVLEQLENTLNIGRIKNPEAYSTDARRLRALRDELNDIMQALHKVRPYGRSLYDMLVQAEQYKAYPDCMPFTVAEVRKMSAAQITEWTDLCRAMEAAVKGCGTVCNHPLREIANESYSQLLRAELDQDISACLPVAQRLNRQTAAFGELLHGGRITAHRPIQAMVELCRQIEPLTVMPPKILERTELPQMAERLAQLCEAGKRRDAAEKKLMTEFAPPVLEVDSEAAELLWQQAEQQWFWPKLRIQAKIRKSVRIYSLQPKTCTKDRMPEILAQITEFRTNRRIVEAHAPLFSDVFGLLWNNGRCDWDQLQTVYDQAVALRGRILELTDTPETAQEVAHTLNERLANSVSDYKTRCAQYLEQIPSDWTQLAEQEAQLTEKTGCDLSTLHPTDWLDTLIALLTRLQENLGALRDWCGYLSVRSRITAAGLRRVPELLENGTISAENLMPVFYRNIAQSCAMVTVAQEKRLSSFNGSLFEEEIQKYKDTDAEYEQLTRQELVARLSANIPQLSVGASTSSETSILQRAIRSGGRGLSIRKLFDSIPNLLRSLCPCMLMSPISVAQYIDPKYPKFDLVIFDEASQLPTCEAVGAIARGKDLVVVGDPKQLPPTSFFTANHVDEENFEKEDLESVLDDCLALSMPQEHLLWHYRSRHESLIAFSNREYYNNKLYTFPSPNDQISEVRHIAVKGHYDRGHTKQNRAEAEAVVKEIFRRLRDPELHKLSMGVVTFSVVQQNLIQDLLEEGFARDPELDAMNSTAHEPLFVKNLENVQGDERDVIMFSVGYGPDARGKVALNFGPLNRDGGWRRLNVAVSRARQQMLVFSVLRPEQIDLTKTRSTGMAGLKAFLEFAINGKSALPVRQSETVSQPGLEESIAERLREAGLNVQTSIGCSEYKVDIGVQNPDDPDEYMLGILCDGETYRRSGTARDRNILQESMLRSLGWNIHHVWAIDWWEDPEKELRRILDAVEKAKNAPHKKAASSRRDVVDLDRFERVPTEEQTVELPSYEFYDDRVELEKPCTADEFADPEHTSQIRAQVLQVLQKEAPISRNLIRRRMMEIWSIPRISIRVDRTIEQALAFLRPRTTGSGYRTFYWNDDQNPEGYDTFRLPTNQPQTLRSIEDIAPEELAAAVRYILQTQFSLTYDDLVREVAALFQITRCTSTVQYMVHQAVDLAVRCGDAIVDENNRVCRND